MWENLHGRNEFYCVLHDDSCEFDAKTRHLVILIRHFKHLEKRYVGYVYSSKYKADIVSIAENDLNVLKFKCILKAIEFGWKINISDWEKTE